MHPWGDPLGHGVSSCSPVSALGRSHVVEDSAWDCGARGQLLSPAPCRAVPTPAVFRGVREAWVSPAAFPGPAALCGRGFRDKSQVCARCRSAIACSTHCSFSEWKRLYAWPLLLASPTPAQIQGPCSPHLPSSLVLTQPRPQGWFPLAEPAPPSLDALCALLICSLVPIPSSSRPHAVTTGQSCLLPL